MRSTYRVLVEKLKGGNHTYARPRRKWKENIRMDFKGNTVGRCGLDSSGSG
jgi:hypothetical protein